MSTLVKRPVIKRKKADSNTWTLSYGDMVTALLCFFIIFYALEKQIEKKKDNPVKGYSEENGVLREHKSSQSDSEFDYAIETLREIPGIEVMKTSSFVDIYFKKAIFFEKGKIDITPEGKMAIDEVLGKLKNIEGKYLLEIQGHADSTPVKSSKTRWWQSNMELSVLRSLKVHTYVAENFLEKNHLIVSGYGSLQDVSENKDEENFNRRISLRLQLVKK